jgi:hypothetical protein
VGAFAGARWPSSSTRTPKLRRRLERPLTISGAARPFGSHNETFREQPMPASENHEAPDLVRRVFTIRNGILLILGFCIGITLISVGITAALALTLGSLQNRMGPIGQIFESVNAAFSGLGFIALVITFRLQYDELRLQRKQLENQHDAMDKSQTQLRRSADCDIRGRHVELVQMSMYDEDLAEVWPQYQNGISPTLRKQYKYANLILQHQRMMYDLKFFTTEELLKWLQYLFASPIIRSYWEGRMVARRIFDTPNSSEWIFDQLADQAYNETRPPEPPSTPSGGNGSEVVELNSRRTPDSDAA